MKKYKLTLTSNLNVSDENISSKYYNIYLSYLSEDSKKKFIENYKKYNIYIYKYYYIPYELSSSKITTNIKKIDKYKPISYVYYRIYEIMKLYFNNMNLKNVLNAGYMPTIIEVILNLNIKTNNITCLIENNIETSKIKDYFKKIKYIYDYDIVKYKDNHYKILDIDIIKYDFINYSIFTDKYYTLNFNYTNDINIFIGMIFIFKYLNKGGNVIFNIGSIINKNQADIHLILKKYFKFSELYYPDIINKFKLTGLFIILKDFKGIPNNDFYELLDILKDLKKEYPNAIYDKNGIIKKGIHNNKYLNGYLNIPSSSKEYDDIYDFNTYRYLKQYLFMKKYSNIKKKSLSKLPKLPTNEQINASLLYFNKWDIDHYPLKTNKYIKDNFITDVYENIMPIYYKINTPYKSIILNKYKPLKPKKKKKYILRTKKKTFSHISNIIKNKKSLKKKKVKKLSNIYNNSISSSLLQLDLDKLNEQLDDVLNDIEKNISLEDELTEYSLSIERVGYFIDSRRDFSKNNEIKQIAKYDKYKKQYRFYNPSNKKLRLTNLISDKFNVSNITQAYLKMWEILEVTKIININDHRGGYKSFHLCEAPGMFIRAINDYSFTHGVQKFEWNAQSLNPNIGGLSDNFGYIKKYKNNWVWGDVTKLSIIKKYIKSGISDNINLITSDCGLPWGDKRYYKTACCSLMAMLMLLPVGGDLIYKIILPAKKILWNLVYICYQYFQELEFYKPIQNYQSREFYVIGKKYLGVTDEILSIFEYIFDNYNDDIDLFDDSYPEPFVLQMKKYNKIFSSNYVNAIEKQIFIMDNIDMIENNRVEKLIYKGIEEKNYKWIKYFNYRKISPKYKF